MTLEGKNIAVTGSTGGLGRELCDKIASLGGNLILLNRSEERAGKQMNELTVKYPLVNIKCITLDLENLDLACEAVKKLIAFDVDIFIHNAGAYSIPRYKCKSGYENVFQINFATPYYMIRELLPHLKSKNGKVVVVGSIAHNYSRIDPVDVDFSMIRPSSKVYGNAKRYLMFSLYELFKKETEVKLSVVHPGITFTNITAHYPKLVFAIIKHPMKIIFMRPKKAVLSLLDGIFKDTGYFEWIGPRIFNVWGKPKKKKLKTCSVKESELIFKISEQVYYQCKNSIVE